MMEDTTTEQLLTNCTDLEDGNLVKGASNVDGVTLEAWLLDAPPQVDTTREISIRELLSPFPAIANCGATVAIRWPYLLAKSPSEADLIAPDSP